MGPARRPPGRNRLCHQGTTWDLDPPCVLVDTQGEGGGGVFLWYTSSRLGPTSCRGPRRFSDRSTPVGEPVQAAPLGGSLACGLIPLAGGKGGGGGGSRRAAPKTTSKDPGSVPFPVLLLPATTSQAFGIAGGG